MDNFHYMGTAFWQWAAPVSAILALLIHTGCVEKLDQSGEREGEEMEEAGGGSAALDSGSLPPAPRVDREEVLRKRKAAKGKSYSTLTLGDRRFEGAMVAKIDDRRIHVRHEGGYAAVDWSTTPEKVREAWGYDPEAYKARILEEETHRREQAQRKARREAASARSSEVEEKRAAENEKEEREKKKEALVKNLADLESEKTRGEAAVRRMQERLEGIEDKYKEEDKRADEVRASGIADEDGIVLTPKVIGGVSTSRVDREKSTEKVKNQLARAKRALAKIEAEIQSIETQLRHLR